MHLDAIAGNERARAELKRAVEGGTPAHAYLFSGPPGVGKTAAAYAFALDLLEAAGSAVVNAAHPDLWFEDSDAEWISIDVIRRGGKTGVAAGEEAQPGVPAQPLQAFLSLRGLHSNRRVAVLARAERLREDAAAPLLKTIEEPPEGAVLVLCAEAVDLLPQTIRSRCRHVEFQRLSDAELQAWLEARGAHLAPAALRFARGAPGHALRLVADPTEVARRQELTTLLQELPGASWLDLVRAGARFAGPDTRRNRALAREALETWETWLRDLAVSRAGAPELAGEPGAVWPDLPDDALSGLWRSAREAHDRVLNNVNPRLAIEVFLSDVATGGAQLGTRGPLTALVPLDEPLAVP